MIREWLASRVSQMICVIADDWRSTQGRLMAYSREETGNWLCELVAPVMLGRHGLAWGLGIWPEDQGEQLGDIPFKREGDGCAPAGLFSIDGLFGQSCLGDEYLHRLKMPFQAVHPTLKCIDDSRSCFYNRVVDEAGLPTVDWISHENMQRQDGRYELGAFLGHNPKSLASAGSCIFFHVWEAAGVPTAGCTAASLSVVKQVCAWLDETCQPCFLLLPRAEYQRYQQDWGLPSC